MMTRKQLFLRAANYLHRLNAICRCLEDGPDLDEAMFLADELSGLAEREPSDMKETTLCGTKSR